MRRFADPAWAIQQCITLSAMESVRLLDALPPHVLLNKGAWERVIIDNPRAILFAPDSFWGGPSPEGLRVAYALHAQGSDFLACIPIRMQEVLYHRDMMHHPFMPTILECPRTPMKRKLGQLDLPCKLMRR